MRTVRAWAGRAWRPWAGSALAGLLAATGQAPLGLWGLTLLALLWLINGQAAATGWRDRLWRGWAAGAGYFAGTLFWITEPFMVDAARDGWMAPFALVLMAGGMALFWMLAAAVAGLGRSPVARAFGFAMGLAASDLLRGYIFTGFPWALVGHVWINTPVAQWAAFIGPAGLSILTVALALLPVATGRATAARSALALLVLAGLWLGGMARLARPEAPRDPSVRVRLVQPNATQALKWQPGMWELFLDRQMDANAAPAEVPLDLIIWPETAVPYLLEDAGFIFDEAREASGNVPMLLGIQRAEGALYFNSLVVLDRGGAVIASYDKHHLVPFGEYVPFGDQMARFGISAFAAQAGNGYSAGPGGQVLDLGRAGKVLPLICYEAVFPQDLRTAERADWIVQVTNDGWFGNLAGPWQHLAQARLRAIEQGLPLLRAANTGITAVIDAKGRVLQSLPLNSDGWLDADVPPSLATTAYARYGDMPATMLLGLSILVLFRRRRG